MLQSVKCFAACTTRVFHQGRRLWSEPDSQPNINTTSCTAVAWRRTLPQMRWWSALCTCVQLVFQSNAASQALVIANIIMSVPSILPCNFTMYVAGPAAPDIDSADIRLLLLDYIRAVTEPTAFYGLPTPMVQQHLSQLSDLSSLRCQVKLPQLLALADVPATSHPMLMWADMHNINAGVDSIPPGASTSVVSPTMSSSDARGLTIFRVSD